jgi:cell fate (sporulation/competence/biofilm development) regulator YlbF (YheA/YmcA/DUF963 family)
MDPQIIDLASQLGKTIAQSPQAARLHAARAAMSKRPDLEQLLKDYRGQADKIAALEQDNKPIEVDDKQRLAALEGKLLAAEEFKQFTIAQMEYVDLMRKVNQELRRQLAGVEDHP